MDEHRRTHPDDVGDSEHRTRLHKATRASSRLLFACRPSTRQVLNRRLLQLYPQRDCEADEIVGPIFSYRFCLHSFPILAQLSGVLALNTLVGRKLDLITFWKMKMVSLGNTPFPRQSLTNGTVVVHISKK